MVYSVCWWTSAKAVILLLSILAGELAPTLCPRRCVITDGCSYLKRSADKHPRQVARAVTLTGIMLPCAWTSLNSKSLSDGSAETKARDRTTNCAPWKGCQLGLCSGSGAHMQRIDSVLRRSATVQGTDLVALAGRSLRARLAGREIPSVASTPVDIRRKVLRAAVNVCLHCLETGKSVLPTSGWASGLSSIVEDHHPQLFIVSVAAALDLEAQDAAAALEEALVSLCKAALADALPGANRVCPQGKICMGMNFA